MLPNLAVNTRMMTLLGQNISIDLGTLVYSGGTMDPNLADWDCFPVLVQAGWQLWQATPLSVMNLTTAGSGLDGIVHISAFANLLLFDMSNENMTSSTVNAALEALAGFAMSGGFAHFEGGTNGPPSGAGLVAKATLITRGWTVTNN